MSESHEKIYDSLPWLGFLGYLEWSTGLIMLNCTSDEFRRDFLKETHKDIDFPLTLTLNEFRDLTNRNFDFVMTLTHETYHLIQIITTGYLYRFVCNYFSELRQMLPLPFTEETLAQYVDDPPRFSDELIELRSQMLKEGQRGVRVLDLVESAATLYQYQHHYPKLTPDQYDEFLLRLNVDQEYRLAYEVGVDLLGRERAFREVMGAVAIALMFDRPQDVYVDVLHVIMRLPPGEIQENPLDVFRFVAFQMIQIGHNALGSGPEVAASIDNNHPILINLLQQFNDDPRIASVDLISKPGAMDDTTARLFLRILVLRDKIILPTHQSHLAENAQLYTYIAAIVAKIANKGTGILFGRISHSETIWDQIIKSNNKTYKKSQLKGAQMNYEQFANEFTTNTINKNGEFLDVDGSMIMDYIDNYPQFAERWFNEVIAAAKRQGDPAVVLKNHAFEIHLEIIMKLLLKKGISGPAKVFAEVF